MLPNLVLSSSQQTSSKTSGTGNAARLTKVNPNPGVKFGSDLDRIPVVDSSVRGPSSERIVPVFSSKFRSAIPRGTTDANPPSDSRVKSQQAVVARSSDTLPRSGVIRPTFTQATPKKPTSSIPATATASRVVSVAQKNPSSGKAKVPTQNPTKPTVSTFQGVDSSRKTTVESITSRQSSSALAANKNVNSSDGSRVPVFPSCSRPPATAKPPGTCGEVTAGVFSVSDVMDLTLDCRQAVSSSNRQQLVGRTDADRPQLKPVSSQKRKLEVVTSRLLPVSFVFVHLVVFVVFFLFCSISFNTLILLVGSFDL